MRNLPGTPTSWGIVVIGILLVLWSSVFVVREAQSAIKIRLGEVVGSDYGPGLHFKLPLIDRVRYFDRRLLPLDLPKARVLTSEKKNVKVNSFVKWRIHDPEAFFTATAGVEAVAESRLAQFIQNGVRESFGRRTLNQVVSTQRSELMGEIGASANEEIQGLGIQIVDVRIKQVELPEDVQGSVHLRMEKERAKIAREIRSQGQEQARKIRAEADRVRAETLADAYSEAEQIRGEGDALAAKTYAEAYQANAEFYKLYRSLNAYRESFANGTDILLLDPKSDFFRYFGNPGPAGQTAQGSSSSAGQTGMEQPQQQPMQQPMQQQPVQQPAGQ